MQINTVRIVDTGRGPQIEGHRLTVMDVFYYLRRGYEFDFIHEALPSLSQEQFAAVVEYVKEHRDELTERDQRIDDFHQRGIKAQQSRGGIFAETGPDLNVEERAARLTIKAQQKRAEKNGARRPA